MNDVKSSLRAVFSEAAEIADPAARAAFLDSACAGNGALRARVEQLLNADSQAGNFLSERHTTGNFDFSSGPDFIPGLSVEHGSMHLVSRWNFQRIAPARTDRNKKEKFQPVKRRGNS